VELLYIVAFAVALSLDGFGVGVAYGMRKIKIPVMSLIVISLTSSTAIGVSMLSGHMVSRYVSKEFAEAVGALILIFVGIWLLLQTRKQNNNQISSGWDQANKNQETDSNHEPLVKFKIKSLGVVIQILREPTVADIDKSGYISTREAILLGLALAMDALGAGFGAAMSGFSPMLTPLVVGLVKFVLVNFGLFMGRKYAANWLGSKAAILPGWVLILLGIGKVIKI